MLFRKLIISKTIYNEYDHHMLIRITILSLGILLNACNKPKNAFTEVPASKTGIDFNNFLEESDELNVLNYTYFYNGGGVATGDLNNDGMPDIVFTGNMVRNKLYINKGNMKFEDVTTTSGIADKQGWCTGVTLVDINADGWLDIYICRSADANPDRRSNLLFINNKNLTFSEQASAYGLADQGYSTQSAFFDYDRDGDLDAVIINHSLKKFTTGVSDNPGLRQEENPYFASKLYRNDGGHFVDVSKTAGITSNVLSFGLGIVVSDFNNDSWPDFFISNDFNEPDYMFINRQDGTFSEEAPTRLTQHSLYSMGADAADINHDGLSDLITLDMLPENNFDQKMHSGAENFEKFRYLFSKGFHNQYSRNMLHVNNGEGYFSEIGQLAGISNTDWSWSALLKDFDNDGNNDLFVTNGYVRDYTDMDFIKYSFDNQVAMQETGGSDQSVMDYIKKMPGHPMSNYMFRNQGNQGFQNVSMQWGFERKAIFSGAASADLDGDGDLDLVTSVTNGKAGIFLNGLSNNNGNGYLRFSLYGEAANTMGIGAVVKVYTADTLQVQEHHLSRGFQSSMEPIMHFGLGKHQKADSVRITWVDGRTQLLRDLPTNSVTKLRQSEAAQVQLPKIPEGNTLYQELPNTGYALHDRYQSDFSIQPRLNNFISNVSPVMAVADLDRDGQEDIVIGATRAQSTRLRFGNVSGFGKTDSLEDAFPSPVSAIAVADLNGDGYPEIIIGRNAFGTGTSSIPLLQVYLNNKGSIFTPQGNPFPETTGNIGCIAIDFDSTEHVTRIFAGARIRGEDYPLSDTSRLIVLDHKGKFLRSEPLPEKGLAGMLTGAVFTDINGDKKKELITVGEFTPLSVYERNGTSWYNKTESISGLPGTGWWCSLYKTDLDGDGDEDLVAGNYGLNTQFRTGPQSPLTIICKDFDGNGKSDAITSYFIDGRSYPSHSLDDLLEQLPSLRKRFNTYAAYAKAGTDEIFSVAERKDAIELNATEMRTVVLENTGKGRLVRHDLPVQAQYAPIFAIAATDMDRDGKKDLILCGNQSGTRIKYGKYDANRGFIFRNEGDFKFSYLSPVRTGISLQGDIRSIAVMQTGTKLLFGVNGGVIHTLQKK
jgi:hypothetical protein